MKILFKFCLLLALIIGGKLAKQSAPATVAQAPVSALQQDSLPSNPTASVVLVHQVLTSEPVPATSEGAQKEQQRQSSILEIF
jgi:hypothetical protein